MEWISVEDRLPNVHSRVLIYKKSGKRICFGYRSTHIDSKGTAISGGWVDQYGKTAIVTHWMPLPEPPQIFRKEINP